MANDQGGGSAPPWGILWHAAAAGAFFFVLQRFVLRESLNVSFLWAAFFAVAAAALAWHQSRRG